jgi:hypothetical protein
MHGINIGYHSGGSPPYNTRSDLQDRCLETLAHIFCTLYFTYEHTLYFNIIHNLNHIKLLVLYSGYCHKQLMYILPLVDVMYSAYACEK